MKDHALIRKKEPVQCETYLLKDMMTNSEFTDCKRYRVSASPETRRNDKQGQEVCIKW